jgi:hypothetical protein
MRIYQIMIALFATLLAGHAAAQAPVKSLDQGQDWTPATRDDFYGHDQGSRVIRFAWLRALKRPDGQPFLADGLARYGYLPNPANANNLPVGFEVSGLTDAQTVGMTCSACHTRQITVAGQPYRIDGGPAIVDFQSFLSDLDVAVGTVLANDAAFAPFAAAVLAQPNTDNVKALREDLNSWYLRYHTLMTKALPKPPWGPGRLDAVGMIFNRLTGLDLGPPPDLLIPDNIMVADAPVRYPFLWNAWRQDKTQWPGFADNGDDILGLSRNVGEVLGVFALFQPTKFFGIPSFLNSTINFDGLTKLENLIKKIGPPKWPKSQWPIDENLAAQGKLIYDRHTEQGGCVDCHREKRGAIRATFDQTWDTPSQNVHTDTREHDVLRWEVDTGVLSGVSIPFVQQPLKPRDLAFNVLGTSVIGAIGEHVLTLGAGGAVADLAHRIEANTLPSELRELGGAFFPVPLPGLLPQTALPPRGSYESRVLYGIWAAAPYLHNGSVPTLADLLKPQAERVKTFKIGQAYDIANVGLAAEQTQFSFELETTDCSDLNSGNSNCGHEFGTTTLSPDEKKALLEYLKTL